jgi:hypothetical protein
MQKRTTRPQGTIARISRLRGLHRSQIRTIIVLLRTPASETEHGPPPRPVTGSEWDYEQLSVELIRAWRGQRSLAAFSRRLGSNSNMVASWEAKRRWPTAARALWAAERAGVDVCQRHAGSVAWRQRRRKA